MNHRVMSDRLDPVLSLGEIGLLERYLFLPEVTELCSLPPVRLTKVVALPCDKVSSLTPDTERSISMGK